MNRMSLPISHILSAFLCSLLLYPVFSHAQFNKAEKQKLQMFEDSLQSLGNKMMSAENPATRKMKCYKFIPTLVEALKVEKSFKYPFDSLDMISIKMPGDKAFRIFSWGIRWHNDRYRHFGCIQMNTDTLTLFPLYDKSSFFKNPEDTTLTHKNWYGAKYYNIIKQRHWFDKYYYLFGWDGHSPYSNKKVVEVLQFNKQGQPVFGAPHFIFDNSDTGKVVKTRFILEFKEDATVTLNYNEDKKMIIYDHLTPLDKKAKGIYPLYVPDGTYEGFDYKRGKWRHISRVFHKTYEEPPGGN